MVKSFINRWLGNKNKVYLSLVVMLIILVVSLELFVHNSIFIQFVTSGVKEVAYTIEESQTTGYDIQGKTLTSSSTDALITFSEVNQPVMRIQINCINEVTDSDASSNLAYSTISSPSTYENLPFSIIADDAMVTFGTTVTLSEIQLSLTNKLNDTIVCENIVLNPAPRFRLNIARTPFYILIVLLSSMALSMLPEKVFTKLGDFLGKYAHWLFVIALVIIDFIYPIIVTWDSGHYLWLADMFKTNSLNTWDPIRNAVYPFSLYLIESILGQTQQAFLIPMILAHSVFYLLSCEIVFRAIKPGSLKRLWISFAVFMFIALDPTIVGYYHTLLTEYVASFVAVMSCFVAFEFYISEIKSRKFYLSIAYFCLFVPLMWHVKQPYIGAALFPFLVASVLKVIKFRKKTITRIVLGTYFAVAFLTFLSQVAWTNLLENAGNPLNESRQLSTWSERSFQRQSELINESPLKFFEQRFSFYLGGANYSKIEKFPHAFQNSIIGMKIFQLGGTDNNLFYAPPYEEYFSFLGFQGDTFEVSDNYFNGRSYISMFLFTAGFLALPFYLLISLVVWFKKKDELRTIVIILLSTAFLNALAHTMFSQLDRYFFFGYPLILLAFTIDICWLFVYLKNKFGSPNTKPF